MFKILPFLDGFCPTPFSISPASILSGRLFSSPEDSGKPEIGSSLERVFYFNPISHSHINLFPNSGTGQENGITANKNTLFNLHCATFSFSCKLSI
jgi:hypothetical protein